MYVSTPRPFSGMGQASLASSAITGGISAGVQAATSAAALWMNSIQLSHEADTATTQIVNGLEPLLRANVQAYLAGPGTCADQAAAEAAYMTAYQWLISAAACGNGAYGSAGNRCISDRFGPGGATDTTGTKFPWAAYYYQPIANDPRAAGCAAANTNPDAAEQSAIANINSVVSGSPQQTTAGQFASTNTSSTIGSSGTALVSGGSIFSSTLLGLPLWVWGAGLVGFLILK